MELPEIPFPATDLLAGASRKQVETAYQAALAAPDDAEAVGGLCMALHAYEFFPDAAQCYRRTRALEPGQARWAYYLAILHEQEGLQEEAREELAGVLRLAPGNLPARLSIGRTLMASGRFEEAVRLYLQILADVPDSVHAKCGLGKALSAAGRDLEAATWLEKAVTEDRQYGEAHYALALTYRKLGHRKAAERHLTYYRNFKGLEPALSDPWMEEVRGLDRSAQKLVTQAEQMVMRGLTAEAATTYQKAARLDPENVAIQDSLIGVYWGLGDYESAARHYRKALELSSTSAKTHFNYGLVMFSTKRHAEAARNFERALEINPRDAHAYHQLGLTLEELGDKQAAEEAYRKALEYSPNHRQVHFLLGRLLAEQGKIKEAIRHLEQTVNSPDNRTPWFMRALAGLHARDGRPDKALDLVREAFVRAGTFGDEALLENLAQDEKLYSRQVSGN